MDQDDRFTYLHSIFHKVGPSQFCWRSSDDHHYDDLVILSYKLQLVNKYIKEEGKKSKTNFVNKMVHTRFNLRSYCKLQ